MALTFILRLGTPPPGWWERPMLLAGVEVCGGQAPLLPHWVGSPKEPGRVIFSCGPLHLLMEHVSLLGRCWAGEGGGRDR